MTADIRRILITFFYTALGSPPLPPPLYQASHHIKFNSKSVKHNQLKNKGFKLKSRKQLGTC